MKTFDIIHKVHIPRGDIPYEIISISSYIYKYITLTALFFRLHLNFFFFLKIDWIFYDYHDNAKVIPQRYDDSEIIEIEKAYKSDPSKIVIIGRNSRIDFAKMTETNLDTGQIMKIYRREREGKCF